MCARACERACVCSKSQLYNLEEIAEPGLVAAEFGRAHGRVVGIKALARRFSENSSSRSAAFGSIKRSAPISDENHVFSLGRLTGAT